MTRKLVFLLEEASAREMLEGLLPKVLPEGFPVQFVVFEGKSDLEKQMGRKMRAWLEPGIRFVVLRDQDSGDCRVVKDGLLDRCRKANRGDTLVRIACRELESWYLADLEAVEKGLNLSGLAGKQGKKKFRAPDRLGSPSRELDRLTKGKYQKVGGSRAIGPHLDPRNTRSNSFHVFIDGVQGLVP